MQDRRLLRVDLSKEKVTTEALPADLRRKYLGGEGVNARLLWEHFLKVDPKIDPLSPENVLIVGAGPMVGAGFGAGSKTKFTYKSPAYNIYGDTSSGGFMGSQMRWAGYDHIVVTGKAKRPVYLWVHDDDVEIKDASRVWGKDAHETETAIRNALGDDRVAMSCIGQAGENLVRIASIIVDGHRAAARGGGGCVFGSKNLKAVVARGKKGLSIHDPAALFKAITDFLAARNNDGGVAERRMRYGTLASVQRFHDMGFNTYRNGQGNREPHESARNLGHDWYTNNLVVRFLACSPGCAFGCGGWHRIRGNETAAAKRYAGEWATKPEYGAVNPFGMACDIQDMPAVAHINKACNKYGMDTMETGMSIAFLMELWDRGIITAADTAQWYGEPLSLEWGNYESVEKLVEAMAFQNNALGQALRGGVYQTARNMGELKGVDAFKYACYGKGGATHEGPIRPWPTLGIACALVSIGAHHLKGVGIGPAASLRHFGKPDAGETMATNLKGAGHAIGENLAAISNSLGHCTSLLGRDLDDLVPLDIVARGLNAVAGLGLSGQDLLAAGERVVNIQKAFNSRLGLRRADDTVCHRWMNEPWPQGVAKGMKIGNYLESAKDEYYERRGWDTATALQTRRKLDDLDMQDVVTVLERENAIA